MTIFDSKSIEINQSTKPKFCGNIKLSQWYFELSSSKGEYKTDENVSSKRRSNKRVTFADEQGRLLVNVIFIDRTDLSYSNSLPPLENPKLVAKAEDPPIRAIQTYDWVTSFIQPASVYNRFKSQLIKLNTKLATAIIVKNSLSNTEDDYDLTGVIKVINLCFQKRVFVRMSSDSKWSSSRDYEAKYKSDSCEYVPETNELCNIDEFEFQIKLPTTPHEIPTYLEFAVCMETFEGCFWDSNCDKNYRLDYCQVVSDNLPSMGLTLLGNGGHPAPGPYTLDYKPNLDQFRNEYTQYRAWNHFSDEMSFY